MQKQNKKNRHSMRLPSQRQLRVGELFRHQLSAILVRNNISYTSLDTRLITVSEICVSSDLKHATVYIMPLGGHQLQEVVVEMNRLSPQLRGRISQGLRLKYVPVFVFKEDTSFAMVDTVDRLLNQPEVQRDIVVNYKTA